MHSPITVDTFLAGVSTTARSTWLTRNECESQDLPCDPDRWRTRPLRMDCGEDSKGLSGQHGPTGRSVAPFSGDSGLQNQGECFHGSWLLQALATCTKSFDSDASSDFETFIVTSVLH